MADPPSTEPIPRLNAALEGRYRVERELGEGGMATVYLAEDLRHERKVALKVLKPELAAVVGAERFLAEIKTTANLQHPHILPLFDSGQAESFLFYVMPYVEGESLRSRLDREEQLPVDEAVRIATNVAEGLDYAHQHGVIHRDVKPANILLQAGKPVISDFGIALAVGAAGGGRLTETGLSLGTPHYMSPEQATGGHAVGPATDVYALGCVLYEMLVGEPPYTGPNAQAVLGRIITGETVSAAKHRASVPSNVDAAIRKALEKLPADRFAAAGDLAKALGNPAFRHDEPVRAAALASRRVWNPVSIGATALAVVFAATTVWLADRAGGGASATRAEVTRLTILPPPGVNLNAAAGLDVSPDGRTLVFTSNNGLFRRNLGALDASPIAGPVGAPWMPFFSPDGEWVAFFDTGDNALKRVRLDGTEVQTIAEAPSTTRSGGWAEDGTIVFNSTSLGGLVRVGADGLVEAIGDSVGLAWLDMLPGGRAVIGTELNPDDPHVALVRLDTGEIRTLLPGMTPRYVAGHIVFWRDGALWAVPFDVGQGEVTGAPVSLVQGVAGGTNLYGRFAVSDNVLAYERGTPGTIVNSRFGMPVWVDREGNEEPLGIDEGLYNWPRISPDGTKVALVRRQDNTDVWIFDLGTGASIPLTTDSADDSAPIWTPDGERVVFRSNRDGASNLYWRRADAADEIERLTDSPTDQRPISVTADGSTLLFEEYDGGAQLEAEGNAMWSMALEAGATPEPLLPASYAESQPTVSPNGRFIAYQSSEAGYPEIFVRSYPDLVGPRMVSTLDTGAQTSATNADPREARSPVWGPDGTELFYQSGRTIVSVPVSTESAFTNGVPQVAFTGTSWPFVWEGRHYDLDPDGQRILRIRTGGGATESVPTNGLVVIQNWQELLRGEGSGP